MEKLTNVEELEFVAECQRTEERIVFTMADLYGWDDETVFLDTSIYLNRPREVNWAIVCRSEFGRRLNPEYQIHIRTQEDRVLKEPLRLLSIKQYAEYRFEAEFSNYVVRTGSFLPEVRRREELLFYEDEFEFAMMSPRGIVIKNDIFISAKEVWRNADEYVHYGCHAEDFDVNAFHKVKNIPFSTKPSGGFWASPTHAGGRRILFDWEIFCRTAEYQPKKGLGRKFYFCVDVKSCIFKIASLEDYHLLPKIVMTGDAAEKGKEFIDFEECVRQGIDAIEYAYSAAHQDKEAGEQMDIKMMGWDCDSILIMNPTIILRESFLKKIEGDFLVKG